MVKLTFQHHNCSIQCHIIFQKSFKYADLLLKKHFLLMFKTGMPLNILWKLILHVKPMSVQCRNDSRGYFIFVQNTFSNHLIPLRCIIHNTMVALTQKRMKKSTVSARNLRSGEGMVYSLPERTKDEDRTMKLEPKCAFSSLHLQCFNK